MFPTETSVESSTSCDSSTPGALREGVVPTIGELVPSFLRHCQFDRNFSVQTIEKYKDCLNWAIRDLGDMPVSSIDLGYVTILKQKTMTRGAKMARVASIVFTLKSFLNYCKQVLELNVLDYKKITSPRQKPHDVIYLNKEEIQKFVEGIKVENQWNGKSKKKCVRMDGLRFRTLVETLLGTGMRIGEALSLNRSQIDFEKRECKIVGKGAKERTVFFNQRSLDWIKFYLEQRQDKEEALFVNQHLKRVGRSDADSLFRRHCKRIGFDKVVSPHTLRHSTATYLLFAGCPIGHIKEILGHQRLETTCKFYLGLDKSVAKQAHAKYLDF